MRWSKTDLHTAAEIKPSEDQGQAKTATNVREDLFKKKRILFLYTGGTIAMDLCEVDEAGEQAKLSSSARDLVSEVPAIRRILGVGQMDSEVFMNEDSADLQPDHWVKLSERVYFAFIRDGYDGIVIVHGTDTMAYGASLLAYMLGPVPGPVVFTGAQRPLSDPRSDASSNLIDACVVASLDVPEVCIAFASKVLRAVSATKHDAWSFAAFDSPMLEPLIQLGLDIHVGKHVRKKSLSLSPLSSFDRRIEAQVLAVRIFPGLEPGLLSGALRAGMKGLVLSTYGTGTMPIKYGSLVTVIKEAQTLGAPVMVVSQCQRGHVDLGRYAGGEEAAKYGAISGGKMTVESALAKMMVGLGRFGASGQNNLTALRHYLQTDQLGENEE